LLRGLRREQLPKIIQRGAAMPVTVPCPNCGTKLRIPDTAVGKRVKCSKCATAFTAEAPAGPPEPQPEPAAVRAKPRPPAPPPPADEPPEEPEPIEEPEPAAIRARPRKPARRPRDEEPEEDLDDEEEVERRIRRRPPAEGGIQALIPYKNGRALGAYYCGVFSLIPCAGNILGPIALILGVLGLRFANEYPTAGGKGHAIAGIVLGLITTVLYWGGTLFVIIIGVLSGGFK
jgi:predicted Zn finger-like uncharacterized protein